VAASAFAVADRLVSTPPSAGAAASVLVDIPLDLGDGSASCFFDARVCAGGGEPLLGTEEGRRDDGRLPLSSEPSRRRSERPDLVGDLLRYLVRRGGGGERLLGDLLREPSRRWPDRPATTGDLPRPSVRRGGEYLPLERLLMNLSREPSRRRSDRPGPIGDLLR